MDPPDAPDGNCGLNREDGDDVDDSSDSSICSNVLQPLVGLEPEDVPFTPPPWHQQRQPPQRYSIYSDNSAVKRVASALSNEGILNGLEWLRASTNITNVGAINRIIPIEVNVHSTLGCNLTAIWHQPFSNEVCVQLREGSRCLRPKLIGRLLGSSLAMLEEWKSTPSPLDATYNSNNSGTTYCGTYENAWLVPGTYSIEIIVVHCYDFGSPPSVEGVDDFVRWLKYDFGSSDCIEDPRGHRLTSESASLSVMRANKGGSLRGHWVYSREGGGGVEFMHTRYQPQGCPLNSQEPRCVTAVDNQLLKNFTFVWRDVEWIGRLMPVQMNAPRFEIDIRVEGSHTIIRDVVDKLTKRMRLVDESVKWPEAKVCLVGYSHSYHLLHALWLNNIGYRFVWPGPVKYPTELTTKFFYDSYTTFNCTKFVIAVGQWSLGWPSIFRNNMTLGKHLEQVSSIVNNAEIFRIGRGDIKLYMRSMHHNAMGAGKGISTCENERPVDWRSPTAVDGYNYVLEKVVKDRNDNRVQFLDTSFITFPMWDRAYDFCHVPPHVGEVEALYIATEVLLD